MEYTIMKSISRLLQNRLQQIRVLFVMLSAAVSLLFISCLAASAFAQPAAILRNALGAVRSIGAVSCSVVRKQSCNGVVKISRCFFCFDRETGRWAYTYAKPFDYTFIANDSTITGVNRRSKQGYCVNAVSAPARFNELLASVHLFGPLLRFTRMDTLAVSLKASINDFLYFERETGEGREIIKADRAKNAIVLVEMIDSSDNVRRQTVFEYDTASKKALFPNKIIVRQNPAGTISVDTLLISKVEINKKLKASAFEIPAFVEIPIKN